MKNKKIYKAIACVSVWLAVVFACVGLACFNSSKVNAGVIIEQDYSLLGSGQSYSISVNSIDTSIYIGVIYIENNASTTMGTICTPTATSITFSTTLFTFQETGFRGDINNKILMRAKSARATGGYNSLGLTASDYAAFTDTFFEGANFITVNEYTYFILPLNSLIQELKNASANNANLFSNYDLKFFTGINSALFKLQNTIQAVDNIYDLQQGDVAIMYISDVGGFDSENYQPEITMNWGYIDSSDNTVYAVYSPTINVMKGLGDLEIWLNIPTDAGGTVYDSVILNQQALLSLITDGASSANANIYALYVWLLSDRIQWGLLNFNTAGLPASAQSMNYFTSYTTKYDYINTNTGTMTCRLSISNNFNFITIKNQPVFSVNTINTTLRQGGLLPAWALYNWARGTAAGYTSGAQAGAAPYQPGGTGYNEIFQAGYDAGLTAQPAAAWYEAAFAAVDSFLNIHIFPSITFGELFGIPFVITVVYFIIRMFRGGGSNG